MVLLPAILVVIELVYFSNVKDLAAFHVFSGLKKNEASKVNVTFVSVHLLVLLTGIILQWRIERDHVAHQDGDGCIAMFKNIFLQLGNDINSGYKIIVLRVVLVIGCGLALLSIYGAFFANDSNDHRNNVLLYHVLLFSVFPSWFVYNHKNLRALAKKQLLPSDNPMVVVFV